MPDLCAYPPCKCMAEDDDIFCGEVCAMLGGGLVTRVHVETTLAPDERGEMAPRCACGHDGCGDSFVSRQVN